MDKKTIKISGKGQGFTANLQAGHHSIITDEPVDMGGKDQGSSPLEYTLAALAGCENVLTHMIAKEMNFNLDKIDYEVSGTFDMRGLMGEPNIRPYFNDIHLTAKLDTTESNERIQALKQEVDQRCPMYTMLQAADIDMKSEWVSSSIDQTPVAH